MADLLSELERFDLEMKQLISETSASDIPPDSQPSSNGAVKSQEKSVDGITTAPSKPSPSASSKTTSLSGVSSQAWVASSTDQAPQFTYLQGPSFPSNLVPAPPVTTTFYPQYSVQQYQPQQQLQPPVPQYQYQGIYPSITAPEIYSHPQQQQAQVLFQKDAQTITPEALENVKAALASGDGELKSDAKRKAIPRKAAGQTWEDPSLAEWPENDYRLFCGDLGNEVNDEVLTKAFTRFPSFNMARVVRDKRTGKTKGYGFVSFSNPSDLAIAMKEMNGKYVGNRPIKLRKSNWKERIDFDALEKQKLEKQKNAKKPRLRKNVLHK